MGKKYNINQFVVLTLIQFVKDANNKLLKFLGITSSPSHLEEPKLTATPQLTPRWDLEKKHPPEV